MNHKQSCIYVKEFVDKEIVSLVKILNKVPDIKTCSSCENNNDSEDYPYAHIVFEPSNNNDIDGWYALSKFCKDLSDILKHINVEMNVRWICDSHEHIHLHGYMGFLRTDKNMKLVIKGIKKYIKSLK